jgi:molybdopterin converting factor small subunit
LHAAGFRASLRHRLFAEAEYPYGVRIHLLYFGMLKDLFGAERDTLELPQGARVEDAIRLLRAGTSNPQAIVQSPIWDSLAVAVNREYAGAATPLRDADELALLPPVSGGLDQEPAKVEIRFQ